VNGTSKCPSRDGPRGGSGEGTEDTEARHFSGSDTDVRQRMCWQIGSDRVVTTTRDFVWLQPVIQTHDFTGDIKVPWSDSPYCQRSRLVLPDYEIPRILHYTRYPADCKTCYPNQIDPLKMQSVIRPAISGADYAPAMVCNGSNSFSDDSVT
jgi:hypothetical protein